MKLLEKGSLMQQSRYQILILKSDTFGVEKIFLVLCMPEVTVMVVIGIDHNLLHCNLWVDHDDLQFVGACSDTGKRDFEPAHVVKDLITTWQFLSIPIAA